MSLLDLIAKSMFEKKPALFREIRQGLCKHLEEDQFFDKHDGSTTCIECGKLMGYYEPDLDTLVGGHDWYKEQELTKE